MSKFKTVRDLNKFFSGRKILVLPGHEWEGEETDFVEMCHSNGETAAPHVPTGKRNDLVMKVKTRFGTELLLEGKYMMTIEKKILQRGKQN